MNVCEFCNKNFKYKRTLDKHQKNAIYCLKIQNTINNRSYNCYGCDEEFIDQIKLEQHRNTCIPYKDYEIKLLKDNIKNIEKENYALKKIIKEKENVVKEFMELDKDKNKLIKDIEKKVKTQKGLENIKDTIIDNKILSMSILDFNDIHKNMISILDKYEYNDILEGQKGFAKFIVNNILTDSNGNLKYVCVNLNEKIFKFLNPIGNIEKDIGGQKIINIILKDHDIYKYFFRKIASIKLPDNLDDKIHENIRDLLCFDVDGHLTIFKNELVKLTTL